MTSAETRYTLSQIDREYTSIGCLGRGGFGSVFLAKKKSGRRVALKFILMDTNDDDGYDTCRREIEAVIALNTGTDDSSNNKTRDRAQSIVFFEEWFECDHFVCIVMNYADGGTLSQEIERRALQSPFEPYAERRIAWYALQLCEALAYAHEKGIAHHDVKAANVLIDAKGGGKLLLADFGTSVTPGEESVGFTQSYAAPELLAALELEDFSGLDHYKIDSFGLGCVLYELLMCSKLEGSSREQTLSEFITDGPGLEVAMTLGHMRLPWLPPSGNCNYVGYTNSLKVLVMNLLNANVRERWLPSQLQDPLRKDPLSPLLQPNIVAAQTARPGAPVTMDNVQLGMLVQRGPDWEDDDADGGNGSIGVVIKLDADALYTEVAFPSPSAHQPVKQICCRIGAENKHELQVGPTPFFDYCTGSANLRHNGIVLTSVSEAASLSLGKKVNQNCVVVGVSRPVCNNATVVVFAAPTEKKWIPPLPKPNVWHTNEATSFVAPRECARPPSWWQRELGLHVNVVDEEERSNVLELFYDTSGGLKEDEYVIESIQRIQDIGKWECYARRKESIAMENWGIPNEILSFWEYCNGLSTTNMQKLQSSSNLEFSPHADMIHNKRNAFSISTQLHMVLGYAALGRVYDCNDRGAGTILMTKYHTRMMEEGLFNCRLSDMVYPQYIITYRSRNVASHQRRPRRIIHAMQPQNIRAAPDSNSFSHQVAFDLARQKLVLGGGGKAVRDRTGPSPTKQCVVCLEHPVRYLLIPCGHPCICEKCISPSLLRKLNRKCPECRATFRDTAIIYGRVVNDEA